MSKLRTKAEQKKIWLSSIKEIKVMMSATNKIRMQIADVAIKACDIRKGGGGHWDGFAKQYTIKKLAGDVGMHPKTLNEWVRVRKTFSGVMTLKEIQQSQYKLLRMATDKIAKDGIKDAKRKKQIVIESKKILAEDNTEIKIDKYLTSLEYVTSRKPFWNLPLRARRKLVKRLRLLIEKIEGNLAKAA